MTPPSSTERVVADLLRFTKRLQVELDSLDQDSDRAKDIKDCLEEIENQSNYSLERELHLFEAWQ